MANPFQIPPRTNPPPGGNPFTQEQDGYNAPQHQAQQQTQQEELPFMAKDVDKYGLPYYGEGFQGFARKTFAKIFDPNLVIKKQTEEQAQLIEQAGESDILN